jgi:non-canonical (house-cleaning) NTP pyrophosphatase
VAIGSENPVKIRAAKNVFEKVFRKEIEVKSVKVDPKVSHTPSSLEESAQGAIN